MLQFYSDVQHLKTTTRSLRPNNLVQLKCVLKNGVKSLPWRSAYVRSETEKDIINSKCQKWQDQGLIELNPRSKCRTAVFLIRKRDDSYRFINDLSPANSLVVRSEKCTESIREESLKLSRGVEIISGDLRDMFYQIPTDKSCSVTRDILSFCGGNNETFTFNRAPQGYVDSPSHATQLTDLAFADLCFPHGSIYGKEPGLEELDELCQQRYGVTTSEIAKEDLVRGFESGDHPFINRSKIYNGGSISKYVDDVGLFSTGGESRLRTIQWFHWAVSNFTDLELPDFEGVSEAQRYVVGCFCMFLQRCREAHITVAAEKWQLLRNCTDAFALRFSDGKISADPHRISSYVNWARPIIKNSDNVIDLHSVKKFVQSLVYWAWLIPRSSQRLGRLREAGNADSPGVWTKELDDDFEAIKTALQKACLSSADQHLPWVLETDYSRYGVAGGLSQLHGLEGKEKECKAAIDDRGLLVSVKGLKFFKSEPIAFTSRSLTRREKKYSVREGEALGLHWSVEKLKDRLRFKPVTVITDHKPIVSLEGDVTEWASKTTSDRLVRWGKALKRFVIRILYREGWKNRLDGLSRFTDGVADEDSVSEEEEGEVEIKNDVSGESVFLMIQGDETQPDDEVECLVEDVSSFCRCLKIPPEDTGIFPTTTTTIAGSPPQKAPSPDSLPQKAPSPGSVSQLQRGSRLASPKSGSQRQLVPPSSIGPSGDSRVIVPIGKRLRESCARYDEEERDLTGHWEALEEAELGRDQVGEVIGLTSDQIRPHNKLNKLLAAKGTTKGMIKKELIRLHKHFGRPTETKFIQLLERTGTEGCVIDVARKLNLQASGSRPSPHGLVSLPKWVIDLSDVVYLDEFQVDQGRYLCIADLATYYIVVCHFPSETPESLRDTILSQWATQFGLPKVVRFDSHSSHKSDKLETVARDLGFELVAHAPLSHQQGGFIEVSVRWVKHTLRALKEAYPHSSPVYLSFLASESHNNLVGCGGSSPSYRVFGAERSNEIMLVPTGDATYEKTEKWDLSRSFVERTKARLFYLEAQASRKLSRVTGTRLRTRRAAEEYAVGEQVWYWKEGDKSSSKWGEGWFAGTVVGVDERRQVVVMRTAGGRVVQRAPELVRGISKD